MRFMGWIRKQKRKADQEAAEDANKATKKEVDGWFRKLVDSAEEYADEKHRKMVLKAIYDCRFDFMEICGVGEYSQIDWDNPHVKILKLTCDPVNMRYFTNPKYRYKVYEKMDENT